MTIIYWTVSWLSGIWLASNGHIAWIFWLIPCAVGVLGAIFLRRHQSWCTTAICLAILSLGAVRYSWTVLPQPPNHLSNFNGEEDMTVTGIVTKEPDVRDHTANLLLEADSIAEGNGAAVPVVGKLLVHVPRYPAIAYGSRLQMTGTLKTPINSTDFDYETFLARQDIFSEMNRPAILLLETGLGNPIVSSLLTIKAAARETVERLLPDPQAALLNGILLGYDHGLSKDLAEDFQATGTSHIIAISGFNIAIIAGILLRGSRYFVSPRAAGLIAITGISLYTILVGADAAVVRAAIMGALFIVALLLLGRPTFLYATLFAAALFMTLANPSFLWDIGFQLSFMAVLGLMIYVSPWSKSISGKLEPRVGEKKALRITRMIADVSLVTLAAIIMTMPVMLLHFDRISLVSPLANLLIMPAQPGVMIIGGVAAILGMISPVLGQIPAWAAWLLLTYTITLVHFFANVPFSSIEVSVPLVGVLACLSGIIAMSLNSGPHKEGQFDILDGSRRSRIIRLGIVTAIFAVALAGIWAWSQPDGKLHVTFFDVGQGDAILIESPTGRQILVDGGRYPSLLLDQLGEEMSFWDKNIDIIVATHPDEDHVLGLIDTFDHYAVDLLLVNGEEAGEPDAYTALLETASEEQTAIRRALAGEVIELGDGVSLVILHPGPDLETEDRNENSVAMRLVYGDFALLLTGDAEDKAERMMMESGRPLNSTVFKAGHHGSRSSSSRTFLQAVQPQIAVISAGKDNKYGHPHPETLQRVGEIGAAILRTDELGPIEFITDGYQFWWKTDAH